MGCGGSQEAPAAYQAPPPPAPAAAPAPAPVPVVSATLQAEGGKGNGKGKGKGKGNGRNVRDLLKQHFQIELHGTFSDYQPEEDAVLKRAYLVGHPNAKYNLRGQHYEYNFTKMMQKNLGTGKERRIRPPHGLHQPEKPLIAPGSTVIVTVPQGGPGTTIEIADPNNPGQKVPVAVPGSARPGAKMAVPVPEKGETVAGMVKRQEGYSTGTKIAIGTAGAVAGVAAIGVGGVILGEYLTHGAVSGWAEGTATPWVEGTAVPWVEGAAGDAGTWVEGAGHDVGEWAGGVAADPGGWAEGAAGHVEAFGGEAVDWLGDTAQDAGDFVMSLF